MRKAHICLLVVAIAALVTIGAQSQLTFSPPKPSDAPKEMRDAVQRGYNIVHETHKYAPDHVGNKLDCTNCHFDAGTVKDTLSLVGVAAVFPKYNPGGEKNRWIWQR
jgi:thiosulfate dehydrogenase